MNWGELTTKLLSREFIGTILALAISGIAMLRGVVGFTEWAIFAAAVLGLYQGTKAYKEIKINGHSDVTLP